MTTEQDRYAFLHELHLCAACGHTRPIEAAHLRYPDAWFNKCLSGTGNKPHFVWTLPLCPKCHRDQHSIGEREFWTKAGFPVHHLLLSPLTSALVLGGFQQDDNLDGARTWLMRRSQGRLG